MLITFILFMLQVAGAVVGSMLTILVIIVLYNAIKYELRG